MCDICDFQSRRNQLQRMVWITSNIDVLLFWPQFSPLPNVPSDSRIPYFYRNSIKKNLCCTRVAVAAAVCGGVAANVSLTWKWYEIVYEKNFVWGNCLLNQRGPHYPAPLLCCPLLSADLSPLGGSWLTLSPVTDIGISDPGPISHLGPEYLRLNLMFTASGFPIKLPHKLRVLGRGKQRVKSDDDDWS